MAFTLRILKPWREVMNQIIYIVGLVVVVGAIIAFVF